MTDDAKQDNGRLDPRVYFAAERTLLAWVRTGLAMMGFGFVVARFGLFLRELAAVKVPNQHATFSLWAGTTLVLFGVATNVGAAVRHWKTVRRLEQGQPLRLSRWSFGAIVGFILALFGTLLAIYLIFGLDRPH